MFSVYYWVLHILLFETIELLVAGILFNLREFERLALVSLTGLLAGWAVDEQKKYLRY